MLDSIFPDDDGFELCRRIREFDRGTPILFYSGAAYGTDRLKGVAVGAQCYIVKPEVGGLIDTIRRLASPVIA